MNEYILSIDQGTTATKVVLYDLLGNEKRIVVKPVKISTPVRDWVEHSPEKIFISIISGIKEILDTYNVSPKEIIGVAIDNQGETIIPFNKTTLEPLYNAIVWQDNRTTVEIKSYKNPEIEKYIEKNTGLFLDPYFSAPKMKWLMDNIQGVQNENKNKNLIIATSEVWLINKLVKRKSYFTDVTTASRTMLFDIAQYKWDDKLINFFDLHRSILPGITPTIFNYGITDPKICSGIEAPIVSSVVDQQSSLYGHRCFNTGDAKLTLGTGGFLLVNTGSNLPVKNKKLITTISPQIKNEKQYIIDGGIYTVGSALDWLKNKIELFGDFNELEDLLKCRDSNVFFVPALAGLSVPYWTTESSGAFVGLGLDSDKNQMVKAVMESIAFRIYQIINLLKSNGISITSLSIDGGVSNSFFLIHYISELLGIDLLLPEEKEITALGGCYLAGLSLGVWSDLNEIKKLNRNESLIRNNIDENTRVKFEKWRKIVDAVINI